MLGLRGCWLALRLERYDGEMIRRPTTQIPGNGILQLDRELEELVERDFSMELGMPSAMRSHRGFFNIAPPWVDLRRVGCP